MKIGFIRSPKKRNMVLEEVYSILARRGFEVGESIPTKMAQDLDMAPEHDLYVLKARTELALSVAGVLHQRGARLLNPYPSCRTIANKVVATAMMRSAGIPTPRSWATTDPLLLGPLAAAGYFPLVTKPFNGIHSQGITVVRNPDELDRVGKNGLLLAQEFVEGCSKRYKVHCVGDQVFATWKPFSLGGTHTPGQPTEVGDEVREIARRCGKLFGMGLYGMDVLSARDGPVVVDVNSFPGYGQVPGIGRVIADYIEAYAHGRIALPSHQSSDREARQ